LRCGSAQPRIDAPHPPPESLDSIVILGSCARRDPSELVAQPLCIGAERRGQARYLGKVQVHDKPAYLRPYRRNNAFGPYPGSRLPLWHADV